MKVSIIIVTWNSSAHIAQCLQSIQKHTTDIDYEVIVVDNASEDSTADLIKKDFSWVKLIENNINDGFGRANNRGAQEATGDILFFLNDDTQLTENSIKSMAEKIQSDASIGVLGCHLTFADGTHQDSVRRDPHLSDQFIILTKLHNFFPRFIKRYTAQDMDYTKEQDVEQLMGACMMIPKTVFEKADGFDPRFFIWFEEVDLLKRIREEQHKRIVYTPQTSLIHLKGTSFGKVQSVKKQRLFQKSQRQYFMKHHGLLQTALLSIVHPLGLLLSFIVELIIRAGGNIKKLKHGQN